MKGEEKNYECSYAAMKREEATNESQMTNEAHMK